MVLMYSGEGLWFKYGTWRCEAWQKVVLIEAEQRVGGLAGYVTALDGT